MADILASDPRRAGPAALVPLWLNDIRAALAMKIAQPSEPAAHPLSYSEAERIGYRMFEHGKTNNTVSAQCEMQALRIKLGWTGAGASYPPTKVDKGHYPCTPCGFAHPKDDPGCKALTKAWSGDGT